MRTDLLKKLVCFALALLCMASLVTACARDVDDVPADDVPEDTPTEDEPTDDTPKEEQPMYDHVAFTDVDFTDLSNFTEAEGADSGVNGVIYIIDQNAFWKATADKVLNYDMTKFAVSLQGLLNRKTPTLYVDDGGSMNWFRFLRSFSDAPLYGMEKKTIDSLDALIDTFAEKIAAWGIVVWDPSVPATSNLATTVCGVDGYLPVMYSENAGSLYRMLLERFGEGIVKMDLCDRFMGVAGSTIWGTERKSTGSAKCDAYVWALENYLKPQKCDAAHIAYMTDFYPLSAAGGGTYLDNSVYETYLPSQDYIVANGIFTFDLSMFEDHPATDDPEQQAGLDYKILKELLLCQYEINDGEFSQCIGFPPFPYKYTDQQGGKYDAVMAEWTAVEVLTAYNIACVADCPGPSSLYNCSIYEKYEAQIEYSQAEKREAALDDLPEYDDSVSYVFIYGGDYDAAAWTYHIAANDYWRDENRGTTPVAWAFNPNLMERVPMLWDVFYHTATENDYFIAGDSGAGYVNPMLLREGNRKHSSLPDGLEAWERWCEQWYEEADITITGMVLDGNNGYAHGDKRVLETYAAFSPDGIGVWNWPGNDSGISTVDGTAVSGMAQDSGFTKYNTVDEAAQAILKIIDTGRRLNFYPIKTNIASPKLISQVMERVDQLLDEEDEGRSVEVVDPYTFFGMLARELEN